MIKELLMDDSVIRPVGSLIDCICNHQEKEYRNQIDGISDISDQIQLKKKNKD